MLSILACMENTKVIDFLQNGLNNLSEDDIHITFLF